MGQQLGNTISISNAIKLAVIFAHKVTMVNTNDLKNVSLESSMQEKGIYVGVYLCMCIFSVITLMND